MFETAKGLAERSDKKLRCFHLSCVHINVLRLDVASKIPGEERWSLICHTHRCTETERDGDDDDDDYHHHQCFTLSAYPWPSFPDVAACGKYEQA